uniref:Reverse transcriptase domain-containing protein n=1 Tax=Termitomyces sp. T132 TaxID=2136985 RepID=A0A2R4A3W6_9AGAR|nr:hypothetical protein C0989_000010 [Termitomyces sp. T132]
MGINLAMIGYLDHNSYKESVAVNHSGLTHYLRKISKRMSGYSKVSKLAITCTPGWPTGSNSYWSQSEGSTLLNTRYDPTNVGWRGRLTVKSNIYQRRYSTGCTKTVTDKINDLSIRSQANPSLPIDRNLYKMICDPELLYLAYNNIKSKPGNMTPGIVPTTLDGISLEEIMKIKESLKDESFQFKPGRRIQIPKPKGGTRPLTIAPPRDKIVQEAMRMVLEAIYNPLFSNNSHGFRTNHSCHSAWKQIFTTFKATSWVIEGEIKKCFDSIDHQKLISLIETKIKDKQFVKLIWKSLRAGYFEFRVLENNLIGTPQGSIISPILANIYLDQLDRFVEELRINFDKGSKPRVSPSYTKIRYLKKLAEKAVPRDVASIKEIHKKLLNTEYTLHNDPGFKRLFYVRYADDWIIGIRGSNKDAIEIKNSIHDYLKSIDLTLSAEKTKITNLNTDTIKFLGIEMTRSSHIKYHSTPNRRDIIQRNPMRLRVLAPMNDIKAKLRMNKFIVENIVAPKFIWKDYTHKQIIQLYNSVLRGYLNYYSFVHNYSRLSTHLYWILKGSCAKLLAAKFSLKSTRKVMNKFGKDLTFKEPLKGEDRNNNKPQDPKKVTETRFYKPNFTGNYLDFKTSGEAPILKMSPISISSLEKLACTACGSRYRIEMHHIRMMKDLNPKLSYIDKLQAKIRRKQIPLCRPCHLEKHRLTKQ